MRGPFIGFKLKVRRCGLHVGQNLGCENSNIMSTKCKQPIRDFSNHLVRLQLHLQLLFLFLMHSDVRHNKEEKMLLLYFFNNTMFSP